MMGSLWQLLVTDGGCDAQPQRNIRPYTLCARRSVHTPDRELQNVCAMRVTIHSTQLGFLVPKVLPVRIFISSSSCCFVVLGSSWLLLYCVGESDAILFFSFQSVVNVDRSTIYS